MNGFWRPQVSSPLRPTRSFTRPRKKGRQVEIDDGFERVGCRAALKAIGECREPVGVPGLQREQCADGVTPTLRAAAPIGRTARSGDGRGRRHLLARAIACLAFGVAQRVLPCRFAAPQHSFVLRYCNAMQWDWHPPGLALPDALSDEGCRRQSVRRSSCRARGSLASLRGRRVAAAGWGQEAHSSPHFCRA
jgi:hypothetical protein